MVKLSVIIVNYNVKYFIEQCLYSVFEAKEQFESKYGQNSLEILVVDNNSHDQSCDLIKTKFPGINLTENNKNVGFSTANNQAIKISHGEYVLLLNPDTIVAEDTFTKIIDFMDSHPDAGGLGVKMINGNGDFLPESKRSLPTPVVSFYKIFGLSSLFPNSEKFGKYHLSYLDKNETHEVDVLSGAFMLLRKGTIEKAGMLDENFFMYGEDIDLSYRISKAGYKNYYYSDTTIIHYKGESTKKGSLNYVFMFYNAMIIFAKKHFSKKNAGLFSFFIKSAVWLRAGLSLIKRVFKAAFLPVSDSIIFFLGFYFIKPIWESYKFQTGAHYPEEYLFYAVPSYISVWLFTIFISKGYRRPAESKRLFKGILSGTFVILIIYSLLSESYRYSRALLLIGSAWAMIASWLLRAVFHILKIKEFSFKPKLKKQIIILADDKETSGIKELILKSNETKGENIIFNDLKFSKDMSIESLIETISTHKIKEVILSHKSFSSYDIIKIISEFNKKDIEFKTSVPGSNSVIGSNSIDSVGEIYVSEINKISKPENKRIKRISDIVISILFLMFYPLIILLIDNKLNLIKNIFSVLTGKYSWVGYLLLDNDGNIKLPEIKKGIIPPINYTSIDKQEIFRINAQYASNYNLTDDIYIIYKAFSKIGNKNL